MPFMWQLHFLKAYENLSLMIVISIRWKRLEESLWRFRFVQTANLIKRAILAKLQRGRRASPAPLVNGLYGRLRGRTWWTRYKVLVRTLTLCPSRSCMCQSGQALIGAALRRCKGAWWKTELRKIKEKLSSKFWAISCSALLIFLKHLTINFI